MSDVPFGVRPGSKVECILADGTVVAGVIDRAAKGWLRLTTSTGPMLVNLAHVAMLKPTDVSSAQAFTSGESAEPKVRAAGKTAEVDSWTPEQLRALADGMLDGHTDAELAARLGQRKGQIGTLRQAFECARGNVVDDQLPPAARPWVARWRNVLSS